MKKQLTDEDIQSIRKIYTNVEVTQAELAELFHVTQPHVSRIVRGLRRGTIVKRVPTDEDYTTNPEPSNPSV